MGIGASTERVQGWWVLFREVESIGAIPELQNCVASAGCRSHSLENACHPLNRLDYYTALDLTSCEGHPLERLDHSKGLYSWHDVDTLQDGVIGWNPLDQIRGMSVK